MSLQEPQTPWSPGAPEPELEQPLPHHPVRPHRGPLRRLGGTILAALLAVAKFGGLILGGLLKFKFAISFLLSVGVYALFWGWEFGVGFVLLLLVHEMGHVLELRREGVPSSAPLFIPFLGAVVAMREMPKNAWVEAKVGLAGPVLGSAASLATLIWAEQVDSNLLRALAYTGFLINLFNLIPVVPLDGGRAASALHPGFWVAGLGVVALLALRYHNPFYFLVLALVSYEAYRRWQARGADGWGAYHTVSWGQRAVVFAVYMGLVVGLVAGMHAAHVPRPT
jgi:Zn-dependent protease